MTGQPPTDGWILCTTARSGSTLLGQMLRATGVAGNPQSWFHRPTLSEQARGLGLTPERGQPRQALIRAVTGAALQAGTGTGRLFALRLMYKSLAPLTGLLRELHPDAGSDRELFARSFGTLRHVHLVRKDSLAQAISLLRAEQSGLWHRAPDGSDVERLAPVSAPGYDRARIAAHIARFDTDKAGWDTWFRQNGITPLKIDYDDLEADPEREVRRVLAFLDLDTALADGIRPTVAKLADQTSADWARRFMDQSG